MKLSSDGIKCVIKESRQQMLSWKDRSVLNGKVRWWYNPITMELKPMRNESLNAYPEGDSWILVFNTNDGSVVQ